MSTEEKIRIKKQGIEWSNILIEEFDKQIAVLIRRRKTERKVIERLENEIEQLTNGKGKN